jgi:hypothetical protein
VVLGLITKLKPLVDFTNVFLLVDQGTMLSLASDVGLGEILDDVV